MSIRLRLKSPAVRWILLLLVVTGFAVYPALTKNIAAVAYDAATVHIYQGVVYSDAVSDGSIYPRWVQFLHLGLGSPLFTFRAPLAYAGMDWLFRLGLPHPIGWRVMIAVGLLAACAGTYLLVKELTGRRWAALVSAAAFLYAPYVLRNAFERGSPEAFGTFLYPWVLWGLVRLAKHPTGGRFLLASALWAICIASHVLAPLMLAPLALMLAVFLVWRYHTATPVLALLAGGLMTAFIWMPMATEQRWVHVERDFQVGFASPASNPLPLDRLLTLPAVYDVARDNNATGDRVGWWQVLCLVVGVLATIYAWRKGRRNLALAAGATTIVGILLLWMLTSASDPLWRLLDPILRRLQYRSRLMGIQALVIAILTGLCFAVLPRRWERRLGLALIALLILSALPSLYAELQHRYAPLEGEVTLRQVRQAEIATGGIAFTSFGEFMPRWRTLPLDQALSKQLGQGFDPQNSPLADPATGVSVKSARVLSDAWELSIESAQPATLTLNLLFYPRWRAFLDGSAAPLQPQPSSGYAQIAVPAGAHQIALRYGTTPAELVGWTISLLTLLTLLGLAIYGRSKGIRRSQPTLTSRSGTAGAGELLPEDAGLAPPCWLLAGLIAAFIFKVAYIDASTTWLRCVSTPDRVCGAQATTDVPFIGGPRLRGYSVSQATFKPGETMRVNLFWQGEDDAPKRLVSFVHIRNSQKGGPVNPRTDNEIWAQDEHETLSGFSTTEYLPGRLYVDEFRLPLPPDMPPGEYFLEIGWYDPVTGEQLEPRAEAVTAPLGVLWRSILLPSVEVTQRPATAAGGRPETQAPGGASPLASVEMDMDRHGIEERHG
jgi:hypothetical protein